MVVNKKEILVIELNEMEKKMLAQAIRVLLKATEENKSLLNKYTLEFIDKLDSSLI